MVDEKITLLTELTTPATEDLLAIVDDPSGSPITKRVTVNNLKTVIGGFYDAYVCVRDKKAQNTHGGTFTSGAWRTRDINNEQADAQAICSIASNQITLAVGTYRCLIYAEAVMVNSHRLRLYNITDGALLLLGANSSATAADGVINHAFLSGRFTLAAQKTLEVQHRSTATRADVGFGSATNMDEEIYLVAEFWREA